MRCVLLAGRVDENMVSSLLRNLHDHRVSDQVFIDSLGGRVDFLPRYAHLLKDVEITTIAGTIASAAVDLFLLGRTRIALDDSLFAFHEVVVSMRMHSASEEVIPVKNLPGVNIGLYEALSRFGIQLQDWIIKFISEQSGVSADKLSNLMTSGAVLTAEEARGIGLVHTVLSHDLLNSLDLVPC